MDEEPLVTCAFSTYNASKTIESALESAFNQSYKNKEYLIIDDCSDDNTLQIIREINTNQDKNINEELKFINQEINNYKEINIPKSRLNIISEEINPVINLNYPEINNNNNNNNDEETNNLYLISNSI